ncbi:DUF6644 family protein [Steroidobacter sp.]|uniref:DUF6644 family protein n=1 Tax=Steroidobacter sp. TaxID=1978227 RepID=UPI001A527823|nr:DUF6644 family protein [Steroidobacter sp.]MBL8265110.1 hypothetical protein [Steroidobacter sp.]
MDLALLAEQIAELPLSTAIRTGMSWRWLFPTIESLHVVAIGTVFGSIFLLDLRLLGIGARDAKASKYSAQMLPLTWTAFALSIVTGVLLFIANAPSYVFNLQFRLKLLLILLAGVNMAVFQWGVYRRVSEWDERLPPPNAARIAAFVSITCWTGTVFLGRWIGFVR